MKKSELKSLIKECVKEVIFEEGVLSNIITEVATGLKASKTTNVVAESYDTDMAAKMQMLTNATTKMSAQMESKRKEILDAIGNQSHSDLASNFANPEYFAGTSPLQESKGKGALSGMNPGDAGLDITNIPGFENWGTVANSKGRK